MCACVLQMYEFLMSSDGSEVAEDTSPDPHKLVVVPDGFLVQSIEGIRTRVTTRLDGRGYDITKCACPNSSLHAQSPD